MHLYLDIKYLSLIGNRLPLFKKKGDNLWNCRCVICGDSQTKKHKARGYFYVKGGKMFYRCHNCEAGMSFYSFLKTIDNVLSQEYALERFQETDKSPFKKESPKENIIQFDEPVDSYMNHMGLFDSFMTQLNKLGDDNIAVKYCKLRKIPKSRYDNLYYVDDVSKLEQISPKYKNKIFGHEPRLVMPFYDWDGDLVGITARDLGGKSSLRYLELKLKDDVPLIFGTESIDKNKRIYVVEGPIDSLFVKNSIAVAGTGFLKVSQLGIDKNNITYIIDNQPRNKEVCGVYKKVIDSGASIVIWPQNLVGKDVNDIIQNSNMSTDSLMDLIDRNTYKGLAAVAAFNSWKRI